MSDVRKKADEHLTKASIAAAEFEEFDQTKTDAIIEAVFEAALNARVTLAKMACAETELGVWEHKVLKNVLASQLVYENIRHEKTVGIIAENEATGIIDIAQPLGPIVAVIPVTNPTSTVIFKILISLKARNPIIISPHMRAMNCSGEAARICYEAALSAGAPDDCVQWLGECSRELTQALMGHPKTALLLATGGPALVKAAYSSGTPAIGVGSGNVPVCIEESADVAFAVENVIMSKTFDNGTVCASEQAVVVPKSISESVRSEFTRQGCYFLNEDETDKLEKIVINPETGLMHPRIVGQPVPAIAEMANLQVPADTKILMVPQDTVSSEAPFSGEILAPILAYYECDDFENCLKLCIDLNYRGGIGHTASIYSNDDGRIHEFAELINAGRVVVNTPSSQGAVGGIFNTINTSFTLGCGAGGKNITTENISAHNLINIKKLCRRVDNEKWMNFPKEKYLDETLTQETIMKEYNKNY